MTDALPRTLFIGRGRNAATWYRCALPATVLDCDWIGATGDPGQLRMFTGRIAPSFTPADLDDYEVLVLQQVSGLAWARAIERWRAAGITVLYEIDDWLRGVHKLEDHAFRDKFDRDEVRAHELCIRAADGVICSTDWLARRYRSLNRRTWTCRNGIDLGRYDYVRPARGHVAIGWAGGTGHREAMRPWVRATREVMRRHPATRFVSVGEQLAAWLEPEFGDRALAIPFGVLDVYPAAMTHFDIALAAAGRSSFFQGKSDLRWLEASALGLPTIADPEVYPEIEHGVTGFHASSAGEMEPILEDLVLDAGLRHRVGEAARAHVAEHRNMHVAAQSWATVLREVAGDRAPAAA